MCPRLSSYVAKTSKDGHVFYVRMNNSTRTMPAEELTEYFADRWGDFGFAT